MEEKELFLHNGEQEYLPGTQLHGQSPLHQHPLVYVTCYVIA